MSEDDSHTISSEDIHLLAPLSKLTTLRFECPTILSEDFLWDISRTFPCLAHLSFDYILQRVSIMGLVVLLQHCPSLESLELELDCSEIPPPGSTTQNLSLQELTVNHSPLHDPLAMGKFLWEVAPNLNAIIDPFYKANLTGGKATHGPKYWPT